MRNNKRPPKKVQEPLNTNDLIAQYIIKHNNTTYSGRITDAGQSIFLETPKIPHRNAAFLKKKMEEPDGVFLPVFEEACTRKSPARLKILIQVILFFHFPSFTTF
jgi:hypothetical protein